jgi:hypothetical protein
MSIVLAVQILVMMLAVIVIGIGIWANKAKPRKRIVAKYSGWTLFLVSVPLLRNWDLLIDTSDVSLFAEYRKRMWVLYVAILAFFAVNVLIKLVLLRWIASSV